MTEPTTAVEGAIEEALSDADFGKNDSGFDNGRPTRNVQWFVGHLRERGYIVTVGHNDEAIRHEPTIYATNTVDGYLRCRCGWPDPIEEGHFTEHFAAPPSGPSA